MFVKRTISGAVLVAIMIALVIAGGYFLLGGLLIISLIGMFELYRVFKMEKSLLAVLGYIAAIVFYLNLKFMFASDVLLIFMALMILLMFVYVFAYPKYRAKQVMAGLFAVVYVGVMLSYVYQLRTLNKGVYLAFLVFLCTWGCDTAAYCVGMLIGKHKMAPKLSPKKSIEGAVGGVVGAALFTAIYCVILRDKMEITTAQIVILSCIAAVGGLVSMVGDLCASAIKRNYDIKDYGKLIPGHGGVMDRFDSMIITAPIIYYLAFYLIH